MTGFLLATYKFKKKLLGKIFFMVLNLKNNWYLQNYNTLINKFGDERNKYYKNFRKINNLKHQSSAKRGYESKETIAVQTCALFTAS
jgi:hypothetical protein